MATDKTGNARRNMVDGLVDLKQLVDHLVASRDTRYVAEQVEEELKAKAEALVAAAGEFFAAEDEEYEDELRRTL
jgi:hypothetical protein